MKTAKTLHAANEKLLKLTAQYDKKRAAQSRARNTVEEIGKELEGITIEITRLREFIIKITTTND